MPDGVLVVRQLVLPLIFVAAGLVLGFIFEKVILWELRKIAARTKGEVDDILVGSLKGVAFLWFVLAGIYGAVRSIHVESEILTVIHKTLLIIVILSVTVVVARISVGAVTRYSRQVGGAMMSSTIFASLTKFVVFIIGALVILQSLGISITPVLTALGVGGLAVALALQETLSNLFAGIQVIASRQIRPGDYIKLSTGEEGYVEDINWRYTAIRALPNNMIIVPNSKLASAIATNYDLPQKEMAVLINVGVSYGSDLEKVERVTVAVAREVMSEIEGGIPGFEPFIRYNNFGDSSIDFTVILRAREFVNQYLIKHEFVKRLHKRYQDEGIEIPFPCRNLYLKSD
jgi:small-conductance mechanosensitive channel